MKKITLCTFVLLFYSVVTGYAQQKTWTNPLDKPYDTSWYTNPKTTTYGGGEQQVYEINTPAGLGGLAAIVNDGSDSREGQNQPVFVFEVPIKSNDLLIRIGGVSRNDGTGTEKANEQMKIYAAAGHLHLQTSISGELFVYSMSGQLQVRRHISEGTTTIALPKGLYVVRLGDEVRKVSVTN